MGGKRQITLANVQHNESLVQILEAMDTEIGTLRTLANELRTDTLGSGTSRQLWETEVDGDLDNINNYLHYMSKRDGVLPSYSATTYTLATQAGVDILGAGYIRYRIGGIEYECALDTSIVLEGAAGLEITAVKFCAWRVMIDKYGVVTTQADIATGAVAHDSDDEALYALAKRARTVNTIDIAYITLEGLDAAVFDVGTTNTNHAEAAYTVTYAHGFRDNVGLAADMSIVLQSSANDLAIKHGTVYTTNGNSNVLAVIAAGDDVGWTYNDTITASKWGGHLIFVDLAGTAIITLSADGIPKSSLMAYNSSDLCHVALNAAQLALPMCFAVIGRCVVAADATTFTYDTDDIVGTDGTGVFTGETFAKHDRTYVSGERGKGQDAPTIPATVGQDVPTATGSAAVVEKTTRGT